MFITPEYKNHKEFNSSGSRSITGFSTFKNGSYMQDFASVVNTTSAIVQ